MTELNTKGKTLHGWDPEVPEQWDSRIAWRTLSITTFSLIIGFSVWYLVSAIAPLLNRIGFDLSAAQLYWLTAVPGLAGGILRLVFMFLPARIGTRNLVGLSSALFLIPMFGWFLAVQDANTPYWWLLVLAALTGIGGGCFSGYMPSTGWFFPRAKSGTALGIQAGVGNLGVSVIQFLGPWVMGFGLLGIGFITPQRTAEGSEVFVHNAAIVLVPWAILASVLAFLFLKDIPMKMNFRDQLNFFRNKNTWILSIVYMMTFGAFAGFAAQFGLIINNHFGIASPMAEQFPAEALHAGATYAFLGPLISALVRAGWGPLCDKFGGAVWTFISGVGMIASTVAAAIFLSRAETPDDFYPFLWSMLALFFFTGIGNAGTFKQMPMILPRKQAGGVIGWTGAIGAFGPFVVGVLLSMTPTVAFYWGCVVFFTIATALTWIYYARPNAPFPG